MITKLKKYIKLITTLALLLFNSLLYAQKRAIIIYAENDRKPLANVLIYHKANLIAESNKYGEVTLQLTNVDSLTFIKNEYEDGKRRILRFASFSIGLSALP